MPPKPASSTFAEGAVLLDGEPLDKALSQVLFVEEGKAIRTGAGRAELWLESSNYLRLSENTLVRMHATDLSHIQIELESGVVLMEIGEISRDMRITVRSAASNVSVTRRGLYRMAHGPAPLLKVFDGRAQVADGEGAGVSAWEEPTRGEPG